MGYWTSTGHTHGVWMSLACSTSPADEPLTCGPGPSHQVTPGVAAAILLLWELQTK